MTATLRHLPNMPRRCARIVQNAKAEAAAEEANLITARAVLNNIGMHRTKDIRNSIILLESRGDMRGDLILAHEAIGLLAIRERRESHASAKASARIAKRFRPQMLEIGAGLILAALVAVAFNMWVLP